MHRRPELWIEQSRVELNVATNVGVLFSRHDLVIDHEDHFGRYPATGEFLILVELNLTDSLTTQRLHWIDLCRS